MNVIRIISIIFLAVLFIQCSRDDAPFPIQGKWRAYTLSVEDSVWQVETSPINLAFESNGDYKLEWYGGVEEVGNWYVDFPAITIRPEGKKKETLRIIKMQMDTLLIKGQLQNKSTILGFHRIPNDPKI